jgi:hypothetical protein
MGASLSSLEDAKVDPCITKAVNVADVLVHLVVCASGLTLSLVNVHAHLCLYRAALFNFASSGCAGMQSRVAPLHLIPNIRAQPIQGTRLCCEMRC